MLTRSSAEGAAAAAAAVVASAASVASEAARGLDWRRLLLNTHTLSPSRKGILARAPPQRPTLLNVVCVVIGISARPSPAEATAGGVKVPNVPSVRGHAFPTGKAQGRTRCCQAYVGAGGSRGRRGSCRRSREREHEPGRRLDDADSRPLRFVARARRRRREVEGCRGRQRGRGLQSSTFQLNLSAL